MNGKSVEQKLFEALSKGSGCRLTYDDVWKLVIADDAMGTRITNQACIEAGIDEGFGSEVAIGATWHQFKKQLKEYHS